MAGRELVYVGWQFSVLSLLKSSMDVKRCSVSRHLHVFTRQLQANAALAARRERGERGLQNDVRPISRIKSR